MKFYLTLTDDQGIVLDRFRLEVVGNPADEAQANAAVLAQLLEVTK